MKKLFKLKYTCDACGSNEWIEFYRYYDFDASYEKITWKCLNCGHLYTGNEEFILKEKTNGNIK